MPISKLPEGQVFSETITPVRQRATLTYRPAGAPIAIAGLVQVQDLNPDSGEFACDYSAGLLYFAADAQGPYTATYQTNEAAVVPVDKMNEVIDAVNSGGGGGIPDLEADPAPTLGGDLNTNGKKIQGPVGQLLEINAPGSYVLINGNAPLDGAWSNTNVLQVQFSKVVGGGPTSDANGGIPEARGNVVSGVPRAFVNAFMVGGGMVYFPHIVTKEQAEAIKLSGGVSAPLLWLDPDAPMQREWVVWAPNSQLIPEVQYDLYIQYLSTPSV